MQTHSVGVPISFDIVLSDIISFYASFNCVPHPTLVIYITAVYFILENVDTVPREEKSRENSRRFLVVTDSTVGVG